MRYLTAFLLLGISAQGTQFTQGTLRRTGVNAADCPLKRTSVQAEISGMLARVTVVQQFQNTFAEAIEAIYIFPLPHEAGVDRMTMTVAGRTIKGVIKRRQEARALYDAARAQGERPVCSIRNGPVS